MSELYVMEDIDLDEEVLDAVNVSIVNVMQAIREEQLDQGPTDYIQPHVQLLHITSEVGALRLQQAGLETLLSELAGEDKVFSDGWLTISKSMHALDSVFDQLYVLTKIYTKLLGSIGSSPELTQQMVDKANEIVELQSKENPAFGKIYSEFLGNADTKSEDASE